VDTAPLFGKGEDSALSPLNPPLLISLQSLRTSRLGSVSCGISRGSLHVLILLMRIIERHGLILIPHLFADDTQVCGCCSLRGIDDLAVRGLGVYR